ncbi:MAG: DUF1893 domain-containing protein [Oscillospiraceae bacterium]|nr:DUF1893 domain-containing protein [Oscillospiraceae bacterium]
MTDTRQGQSFHMIVTGLMVALGLIIPFATAHGFGLPGTVLLPMHMPILLCGLLLGARYGLIAGLITPLLSSVLTGMPPVFPMLPIMIVQLGGMGFVSGFLRHRFRLPLYVALIGAMLSGQVLYGLMFEALLLAAGAPIRALSVSAAITTGLPGLLIQLTLIPAVVKSIEHVRAQKAKSETSQLDDLISEARRMLKAGEASCVVIQNDKIVYAVDGRGVSPLLNLYQSAPEQMKGAYVVDKIIGKAAAVILTLGEVRGVYGEVTSVAAESYLKTHGIDVRYGICVDVISNRGGTGICPIERSVLHIDDPREAVDTIIESLETLRRNAM